MNNDFSFREVLGGEQPPKDNEFFAGLVSLNRMYEEAERRIEELEGAIYI
jgi:hypothetical protein